MGNWGHRASMPFLSTSPFQHLDVFPIVDALQTLSFRVLWRFHHVDMMDQIIGHWWLPQSPAFLHSLEVGEWGWDHALVFWNSVSIMKPFRGHSYTSEISRALGTLVSGTGDWDRVYNRRCSYNPYHSGNYKHFRSSCQELGRKTKSILHIISQCHIDAFILQPDALGACLWVRNSQFLSQVPVPWLCSCLPCLYLPWPLLAWPSLADPPPAHWQLYLDIEYIPSGDRRSFWAWELLVDSSSLIHRQFSPHRVILLLTFPLPIGAHLSPQRHDNFLIWMVSPGGTQSSFGWGGPGPSSFSPIVCVLLSELFLSQSLEYRLWNEDNNTS